MFETPILDDGAPVDDICPICYMEAFSHAPFCPHHPDWETEEDLDFDFQPDFLDEEQDDA